MSNDVSETIRSEGTPLRTVKLILGMDQQGRPMAMQITRNEFQNIYLIEGDIYIIKTFHDSDKEVFTFYPTDKFFSTEFEVLDTKPSLSLVSTNGVSETLNEVS